MLLSAISTGYGQVEMEKRVKPEQFMYVAEMEKQVKKNTLYRVHISTEILQKCSPGYKDIRVFNENHQEVPFVLLKNMLPAREGQSFDFEIIGYEKGDKCSILTIKTPEDIPAVDSIDIRTPGRNFKKKIFVDGSEDGKSWELLAEDVIYDFSAQVDLSKTKLQLPGAGFAYYRLRLCDSEEPDAGQTSIKLSYEKLDFSVEKITAKKLRIETIVGQYGASRHDKTVYDEKIFDVLSIGWDDRGDTIINLDAGVPCATITFDIKNANFFRRINIYGKVYRKDSEKNFFTQIPITTQPVYRFSLGDRAEEKTGFNCHAPNYRSFYFEIENKNSPPLDIKSISFRWVQVNLYFIGLKDNDRCTLYFGSSAGVPVPDYDISTFLRQDNIVDQKYEALKAVKIMKNPEYTPTDKADRKTIIEKNILTLVIILLVIIIGFWFYKLYKKI